jgi:hypothetical protein
VCNQTGAQLDTEQQCEHVETNEEGKITLLWDVKVQTDGTIRYNKPDIVSRDNGKGTCMLIDVAVSGDGSVIEKEAEKIVNYKDLATEVQSMWNVKNEKRKWYQQ